MYAYVEYKRINKIKELGDAISIFPSYRQGSVTNLGNATSSASSGGDIDVSFYTSLVDGTTLYYTLE